MVNEEERVELLKQIVDELEPLVKQRRQQQMNATGEVMGLTFDGLMRILVKVDALNTLKITEKERLSVLST